MTGPAAGVGGRSSAERPAASLRPLSDTGLGDDVVVALVDAAPDGILVADDAGRILLVNAKAEELFGWVRADLLGRCVDELLPERFQQVHETHRARYRAEPRTRAMGAGLALFGRRADGSEFPVEISLSPLDSDSGLKVVAVVREISDRVAVEAEQREVRESLDATTDAVLMLDAESLRFTYVNEGAVQQVGYTRDELLGMPMLQITPELREPDLRELLEPLAGGGKRSITFTTMNRHRNGTDIPVEILMQAIPSEDGGSPRRYVKIARDIRERMATEARLRTAEQHLRVVEDRERIARDLHDIVIQKLFAAGMTLQGECSRTTEPDRAQQLSAVVDDLDDTIREIRSVIFSLQTDTRHPAGVRATILAVVDDERSALGFEPRVRFDGAIEAISGQVATELLAVLREALSNVARHAHASDVQIVLECADDVVLRVQDNGVGMPATAAHDSGIRNIDHRAETLGGQCRINTRPEGGVELEWRVPNQR